MWAYQHQDGFVDNVCRTRTDIFSSPTSAQRQSTRNFSCSVFMYCLLTQKQIQPEASYNSRVIDHVGRVLAIDRKKLALYWQQKKSFWVVLSFFSTRFLYGHLFAWTWVTILGTSLLSPLRFFIKWCVECNFCIEKHLPVLRFSVIFFGHIKHGKPLCQLFSLNVDIPVVEAVEAVLLG